MAIAVPVAGAYSATYASLDVGFYRDENGFELEQSSAAEMVDNTDIFGGSLIDFVYRGGNVKVRFTGMVYTAGALTPFWPWGLMGVMATPADPVGRMASNIAAALVMTTFAALSIPNTLTASKAILSPNTPLKLLYTTKVRKVPVELVALPTESAGTVLWWSET